MDDPEHPENYWLSELQDDERLKCHFCPATYACAGSLKAHENKKHNVQLSSKKPKKKKKEHRDHDQLQDHIVMLFKLTILYRNLDSAVDMADRERSVRSAMFEMPIYNKTDKVKYLIGPSTSQPLPQEY